MSELYQKEINDVLIYIFRLHVEEGSERVMLEGGGQQGTPVGGTLQSRGGCSVTQLL